MRDFSTSFTFLLFDQKEVSLSEPKKISLRTESSELVLGPRRDELGPRRDLKRVDKEDGLR